MTYPNNLCIALDKATAFILDAQEEDGSWPDFVVSPTTEGREWTTAYVGWCMNRLPADRIQHFLAPLERAQIFLHYCRRPTGGWGFNARTVADADSTAYGILFLLSGRSKTSFNLTRERDFLLAHQGKNGAFRTYLKTNLGLDHPDSGYYTGTPCVTGACSLAILLLTHQQDHHALCMSTDFLQHQGHDGSWISFWWERGIYCAFITSYFFSEYGSGQDTLRKSAAWLKSIQDDTGCWKGETVRQGIPFLTAAALESLLIAGESPDSLPIQRGIHWLLDHQRADGSWDSYPIMKVPSPTKPWQQNMQYTGPIVPGNRRNFVTATVVSCFSRLLSTVSDSSARANVQESIPTIDLRMADIPEMSIHQEVESVVAHFSRYVEELPDELQALTGSTSLWDERGTGLSHWLPFWLNQEFCEGSLLPQARQMALANRFGQFFCLLQDGLIDKHAATKPEILLLIDAFFFKFVHGYHEIFPASHTFWTYFERYWQEYLQALAWEKSRHHGSFVCFTPEDFMWMSRKFSPVKICCAGIALLAGKEAEIPHLEQMIEYFQIGYQMLDDLQDWTEDIEKEDYTYPLTLVHLRHGHGNMDKLPIEDVGRSLWDQGVGLEILSQAIDYFSLALREIEHLSLPEVKASLRDVQEKARQQAVDATEYQAAQAGYAQLKTFSQDGCQIVFNVSTSALFEVDHAMASLITRVNNGLGPANTPCEDELLEELRLADIFASLPRPQIKEDSSLSTLYLMVATSSKQSSAQDISRVCDEQGEKRLMSLEVGKRAVDLLVHESSDQPTLELDITNGDPLCDSGLVTKLILYGRQRSELVGKDTKFYLITRGTPLPSSFMEFLAQHHVSVEIRLEEPTCTQGLSLVDVEGEEVFQSIADNIQALRKNGVQHILLRGMHRSLGSTPLDILDRLFNLGIDFISLQPPHPSPNHRRAGSGTYLTAMCQPQEDLVGYVLRNLREGQVNPYAELWVPLIRLCRGKQTIHHCAAGITMGAVTPDGEIYPCRRLIEEPALSIGNVFSGLNRETSCWYIRNSVDQRMICRSCWARYLCGGGCQCDNLLATGDMTKPDLYHCMQIRQHMQTIIQLIASLQRAGIELPETLVGEVPPDYLSRFMDCDR